jgi:hypothetical protein
VFLEVEMDVKEAVRLARDYASAVFEGEKVTIEEVWFEHNEWYVTIGIQRPEPQQGVEVMLGRRTLSRLHYKTVRIEEATKAIKSLKNREDMPVSPL